MPPNARTRRVPDPVAQDAAAPCGSAPVVAEIQMRQARPGDEEQHEADQAQGRLPRVHRAARSRRKHLHSPAAAAAGGRHRRPVPNRSAQQVGDPGADHAAEVVRVSAARRQCDQLGSCGAVGRTGTPAGTPPAAPAARTPASRSRRWISLHRPGCCAFGLALRSARHVVYYLKLSGQA